jgi:hypothetical protein
MNPRSWFTLFALAPLFLAATSVWKVHASIKPAGKEADTLPPSAIVIEALIDGQSELRVTKDSLYWIHTGASAKPGRHEKANEPTYVNGKPWMPVWGKTARPVGTTRATRIHFPKP